MVSVNHCSLRFAKQIPSEVGLYQDDFSDEKSVLADTKRKTAFLLFFASTDGLRLPLFQTYPVQAVMTQIPHVSDLFYFTVITQTPSVSELFYFRVL